MFAERGFGQVSLNDILGQLRLTKGALYHHFKDKKDLFRDVVECVQFEVVSNARASAHALSGDDNSLPALCKALLSELKRPEVMRIVCIDAGTVLSWAECAEIDDRHMMTLFRDSLSASEPSQSFAPLALEATTRAIVGSIYQSVEWASHSDTDARIMESEKAVVRMVRAL